MADNTLHKRPKFIGDSHDLFVAYYCKHMVDIWENPHGDGHTT